MSINHKDFQNLLDEIKYLSITCEKSTSSEKELLINLIRIKISNAYEMLISYPNEIHLSNIAEEKQKISQEKENPLPNSDINERRRKILEDASKSNEKIQEVSKKIVQLETPTEPKVEKVILQEPIKVESENIPILQEIKEIQEVEKNPVEEKNSTILNTVSIQEKFESEPKNDLSINNKFKSENSKVNLADKLRSAKIKDFNASLNLNQRLGIKKTLFKQDDEAFSTFIKKLNEAKSSQEISNIIDNEISKRDWSLESAHLEIIRDLASRKEFN